MGSNLSIHDVGIACGAGIACGTLFAANMGAYYGYKFNRNTTDAVNGAIYGAFEGFKGATIGVLTLPGMLLASLT